MKMTAGAPSKRGGTMWSRQTLPIFLLGLMAAPCGHAHETGPVGTLVDVSVEVDGWRTPLYPSPDGSGRYYLEAREGGSYAVRLANRTGERLGVVVTVDGLNAISGLRDEGRGRMYVLGPWEETVVRGWRSSLADVRRFTFVDERVSYAARSGKTNGRTGWIEVTAFRERRRSVYVPYWPYPPRTDERSEEGSADREAEAGARRSAPAAEAQAPSGAPALKDGLSESVEGRPDRTYPGTGWGAPAHDPAVVVSFDPEAAAAERITLRYEYRSGLVALGILPRPFYPRDRLRERERGIAGFAAPPAW
jgi:hypothetical protein